MLATLFTLVAQRPSISFLDYVYGDWKDRQSIVGRAVLSGYGDLRKARLSPGDEEVRVWGGFGLSFLEGMLLRKRGCVLTAVRLMGAPPRSKPGDWTQAYGAPKSNWTTFWQKAKALGIWTLPDDATLPQKDREVVFDGLSYVVETLRAGKHRAYAYSNPEFQTKWPEARKMVRIGKLLDAEFPRPARRSTLS